VTPSRAGFRIVDQVIHPDQRSGEHGTARDGALADTPDQANDRPGTDRTADAGQDAGLGAGQDAGTDRTADAGQGAEPHRPDSGDRDARVAWRRYAGGLGRAGRVVVRPFALALFQGDADPPSPPRSQRLTFRVPRQLAALVPSRTVNLVQVAEFVLAVVLFGMTLSTVSGWNLQAGQAPGAPAPIWDGFTYLVALGGSLPVVLRGRWPLAAWRIAVVLAPMASWASLTIGRDEGYAPYLSTVGVAYLMALYSVAVRCDRRITLATWVITALGVWITDPDTMAPVSVAAAVVLLVGYNVRARRTATDRLFEEERRTRQAEGAQAVLEERARIARELHDVVAHHMSVIAIQAEAAPLRAAGDATQLEAGLAEIRALSLEAIAELRQVLGVLRDQDGRTDTAPQPGLDRVDELVANARNAGLAVLVKRTGSLDGLSPAVELSAYRIVQESLSNAMRHAPGATVAVDITRDKETLRLRIENAPATSPGAAPRETPGKTPGTAPGKTPGKTAGTAPGATPNTSGTAGTASGETPAKTPGRTAAKTAGQGLVGMRERAALLGGTFDASPAPGGGFRVSATLPATKKEGV
jgi:signal transduction histidine kinase